MQPQDSKSTANTSAETACNLVRNRKPGMSRTATRRRARLIWMSRNGGAEPICRICGRKADIHHNDGDHLNNADSNQDRLCRSHHTEHENYARFERNMLASMRKRAANPFETALSGPCWS